MNQRTCQSRRDLRRMRFLRFMVSVVGLTFGGVSLAEERSPKAAWATPPYIALSQRNAAYVNSLPVFGSIEWTLHKMPLIDDGPEGGVSGAAFEQINGAIYLAGGFIPQGDETDDPSRRTSRWAHRFDLQNGMWQKLPNMPGRKEYTRGIAHGNDMYVVGGLSQKSTAEGFSAPSAEVFKFTTTSTPPQWQTHSRINIPRTHPAAGAVGDYLIVVGGNEYLVDRDREILGLHTTTIRDTTEVFDLRNPSGGWRIRKPIPAGPRGWSGSAVVGQRFYLFAGLKVATNSAGKQTRLKVSETLSFDPRADEWSRHADAPFLISGWEGAAYRDRYVLLIGGIEAVPISAEKMGQNTWNDLVFAYDTVEDRWLKLTGTTPPGGVYNDPGVVIVGDTIYVAGGEGPRGSHFNHLLVGKIHQHHPATDVFDAAEK